MSQKRNVVMVSLILLGVLLVFGGCVKGGKTTKKEESAKIKKANQGEETTQDGKTTYEKSFGTYEVPEGWVEVISEGAENKFFYVKDGDQFEATPNNISVTSGDNHYSPEEHEQFRDAIMEQLVAQSSSGDSEGQIYGNGSYTDGGDRLYEFIIEQEGAQEKTIFYYIVGDHRYVEIQVTNFDGSERVEEVAAEMAKSFVWKDGATQ